MYLLQATGPQTKRLADIQPLALLFQVPPQIAL
jgi:hypothetical protein